MLPSSILHRLNFPLSCGTPLLSSFAQSPPLDLWELNLGTDDVSSNPLVDQWARSPLGACHWQFIIRGSQQIEPRLTSTHWHSSAMVEQGEKESSVTSYAGWLAENCGIWSFEVSVDRDHCTVTHAAWPASMKYVCPKIVPDIFGNHSSFIWPRLSLQYGCCAFVIVVVPVLHLKEQNNDHVSSQILTPYYDSSCQRWM